jgi:hypothetical protein
MTWWLAIFLKPLFALVILVGIVLPIKLFFKRVLPEGYIKDVLFTKMNGDRK